MTKKTLMMTMAVATFSLISCVEAPDDKSGSDLWDQYVDELAAADKDAAATETETALPEGDDLPGDFLETPDDDTFVCMYDACAGHADCKKPACVATFCTTVFGTLIADNPNACAMRCDPANNGSECPDGMTCNDQIQQAAGLVDIDGALGICAPPTRR